MPHPLLRRGALRGTVGLGATALILGLGATGPAVAAPGDTVTLLTVNDFHGRISATAKPLACTVVTERAAASNSAFLSAGDNIGASEFASAIQDDTPTVEYLNALGLDASAAGNHEYDKGYADLRDRVQPLADFPILATNVYDADGARTSDPYTIVEAGDVDVAVIGAVTADTVTLVSPAGIVGLEFRDPVDEVNKAVAELEASGEDYDVLVVEYHEGATGSAAPGAVPEGAEIFDRIVEETSPAVDAIYTGHTHQTYGFLAPVPGSADRTRPVMQSDQYGTTLGKLTLTEGADGAWTASAADIAQVPTADVDLASCEGDATYEAAAAIADEATEKGEELGRVAVGDIDTDITTAYGTDGAEYVNGIWTVKPGYAGRGDDRARPSALSNLLADSMVWATQQESYGGTRATIGVMNPGGVRANLLYAGGGGDGVVTYAEANDVVPFVNNLSTVDLTGAQVKTLLEQQWQRDADGVIPSRSYLQLGLSANVTYTADPSRPMDQRITSVTVDGEPVDPEATYTVVAASFLVAGGDNFHVLTEGANPTDTGLIDREAWVTYLGANRDLRADHSQRGIGVQVTPDQGASVVRVTGLESRSLGAPRITRATITVDGREFSAPYRLGADGVWAAEVRVTLPAGEYEATVTAVPETGTAITLPIVLTTEPLVFSDVPPGMQFEEDIRWAAEQGIVRGWDDGTYRPLAPVQRDAMAAFLYRLAGSPSVDLPETSPFRDVTPQTEHYTEIMWAYQEGITTGWSDGTFRPTAPIARDAMAAFVYRYAGEPRHATPVTGPFVDVPADSMYATEIAWMQSRGITTGWPDRTYRPLAATNRDATAAFLHRLSEEGIEYAD